jgi:hypothetical protein
MWINSFGEFTEETYDDVIKIAMQWDFAYDGDGVRVATLTTPYDDGLPETPSLTAYYFGGMYELRSDSTAIKYYSFGGQTVAMDDGTGLQYFVTDHLGSVVATTDSTGTLTSQQRYLPFGGVRENAGNISQTDYGYTGQRDLDSGIGLMDYREASRSKAEWTRRVFIRLILTASSSRTVSSPTRLTRRA